MELHGLPQIHIIGAGGLGRDVAACFRDAAEFPAFWDDAVAEGQTVSGIPVAGSIEQFIAYPQPLSYIIAVGNPAMRQELVRRLQPAHHRAAILVHPDARLYNAATIRIESGCMVFPGAHLTTDISIAPHTVVHIGCSIHHDTVIGAYCVLMPHVVLAGNVHVGERVYISPGLSFAFGTCIADGERK